MLLSDFSPTPSPDPGTSLEERRGEEFIVNDGFHLLNVYIRWSFSTHNNPKRWLEVVIPILQVDKEDQGG